MRSIVFNGVDFSEFCSAEVVEKAALPIVANTMTVPGRAGALLVSGRIPPRAVRVRLFMDARYKPGTNGLADVRHRVYSALASTGGGTLRLPDEPEFEYRDVVCTDAGAWSSLFEDGHGDVAFALLVKFAVLILGALGYATMWLAVFGDVGVTVLAVLNSMRCLSYKKK